MILRFLALLLLFPSFAACAQLKINQDQVRHTVDRLTQEASPFEAPYRDAAVYLYRDGESYFYSSGEENIQRDSFVEIASLTKVFNGVLLAKMIVNGHVSMDATVNQISGSPLMSVDVGLVDLATHRSGLPKLPDNLDHLQSLDPYRGFTLSRMKEYLVQLEVRRPAPADCQADLQDTIGRILRPNGQCYVYSNIGAAVLGQALAISAGKTYEQLLQDQLFTPLSLDETLFELNPRQQSRMVQGYNWENAPTPLWSWGAMKPMGGLISTPQDIMKFLVANLNSDDPALLLAQQRHSDLGGVHVGFGWHLPGNDDSVKAHGGATYGFSSYMAIHPASKSAVFLVVNAFKLKEGIQDSRPSLFGERLLLGR